MHIAFLHRSLSGGGTEADLRRMAVGLAARGHRVSIFAAKGSDALPGVRVHRVPVIRAGRLARLVSFAMAAPRLAEAQGPFDLVVGFGRTLRQDVVRVGGGTHRSYLARMQRAGLRGPWLGPYHRAILWIEERQFAAEAYRRVIAVSRVARDEVRQDYGVPRDRIAVVYNGVDLERFHPRYRQHAGRRLRAAFGIPNELRVCAAVGNGFLRKGFDVLLALWREDPPPSTVLLLVGNDERLGRWRRAVAHGPLADRVLVAGPRGDIPAVLAAADVLCMPSRQEAFGNVVLEACAAGVPVVTSRLSGAAELLGPPLDVLVIDDPGNRPALRAAILHALGPEGPSFGQAARLRAEEFSWERHLDRLEHELGEACGAR